jgi:hypothetical protein
MSDLVRVNSKAVDRNYFGDPAVEVKRCMVPLCNARSDPWTMMIVDRNATIAHTAMVDSGCLHNIAGWTLLTHYLLLILPLRPS